MPRRESGEGCGAFIIQWPSIMIIFSITHHRYGETKSELPSIIRRDNCLFGSTPERFFRGQIGTYKTRDVNEVHGVAILFPCRRIFPFMLSPYNKSSLAESISVLSFFSIDIGFFRPFLPFWQYKLEARAKTTEARKREHMSSHS